MEQHLTRTTAIMVDGGYYRVRSRTLWGNLSATDRAQELYDYCMLHITQPTEPRDLYRIFYYDCPPMTRTIKHPLTQKDIDYSTMPGTKWSKEFFGKLLDKRKVALRMGELAENTANFVIKDAVLSDLLAKKKSIDDLKEDDFRIDVKQKGVDMRIGLDVASLAQGHFVNQIVLIAGDTETGFRILPCFFLKIWLPQRLRPFWQWFDTGRSHGKQPETVSRCHWANCVLFRILRKDGSYVETI